MAFVLKYEVRGGAKYYYMGPQSPSANSYWTVDFPDAKAYSSIGDLMRDFSTLRLFAGWNSLSLVEAEEKTRIIEGRTLV